MYKPIGDNLLITSVKQEKEQKTTGGIILMANSNGEPSTPFYDVIDKGEDCSDRIQIGSVVMLARSDFKGVKTIKDDGVIYLFVPEENVSAIIENGKE